MLPALSRLEDLVALVADARAHGQTPVAVGADQLADWLMGWRADRARVLDAEDDARRWKRRSMRAKRRGTTPARRGEARQWR